jgi:ribonuclease III
VSLERLQEQLGYQFRQLERLIEALTHPSQSHEQRREGPDNQRLEFLGDAVVQLVVTECIYEKFPLADEGELTPLRAALVNRQQLQSLADGLGLGDLLILGRGEEQSGGRRRVSNLADAMEAVIGAVFLDGGWEAVRPVVRVLWAAAMDTAKIEEELQNPKGALQERLQSGGANPPQYECVDESGPSHARRYEIKVVWRGEELGRGSGASKKEAEAGAARAALKKLGEQG